MFAPEVARNLKGLAPDSPNRFAARSEFLAGPGRQAWLTWRARELGAVYDTLAAAARRSAPGALMAVATPGLDDGPAGQQARVADGVGASPAVAWRALGLDPKAWPAGPDAPILLRAAGLADDDLGRDLAASPDLDDLVAARPARGLLLADPEPLDATPPPPRLTALPLPEAPAGPDPLGHGLAALDARYTWVTAASVAGQEDRLRQFARVFRALPAPRPSPADARQPSGVMVRSETCDGQSFLAMVNDTPYPILLETILDGPADAPVDDLGRGLRLIPEAVPAGRRLVLELPAFGVAGVRVGAPEVHAATVIPHHPPATLAGMEAQAGDLSARLVRLAHAGAGAGPGIGPINPGFEPEAADRVAPASHAGPRGWSLAGEAGNALEIDPDRPHSGLGSLRVDARSLPAAVACDPFVPPGGDTPATPRAWLRADRPDARVRAWVEGQSGGKPVARSVELVVPTSWTPLTPRGEELSTAGLRKARLRFEMLTPGRLWIDDVTLTGGVLPESDRANARRTLGAALQAYRERRFADFARLANSRWARRVEPGPGLDASAARPGPRQSGRF